MWNLSFLLLISSVSLVYGQAGPILDLPSGTIQGNYATSRDGRRHYEFKAIPFGQVPKRFADPIPAGKWEGILNATSSSSGCISTDPFNLSSSIGTEDCLDLDIYTPLLPGDPDFSRGLPVMVYLIGGGYLYCWSSSLSGKYFMDEDVIIVVPNFRLGLFGFLQAGIPEARGNQLFKDQVLALQWVKDNIASFGGDPNRVTIFGQSSGSSSVSFLTLSPMANGLFHGAIMQSGVATGPNYWFNPTGLPMAQRLGALFDCPTRNASALVDCLASVPVQDLVKYNKAGDDGLSFSVTSNDGIFFSPSVETYEAEPNDPTVFLPKAPKDLLPNNEFARVPMIIGQIASEYYSSLIRAFSVDQIVDDYNREFGRRLKYHLFFYESVDDPCEVTSKLKERFLPGGLNVSLQTTANMASMWDERLKVHSMRKIAREYSRVNPVYMFNFTKFRAGSELPPRHADDVQYLFPYTGEPEIDSSDPDYAFSKEMISLWVSFAANGKPKQLSNGEEWAPLTYGEKFTALQIDDEQYNQQVDDYYEDSWRFWDSLGFHGPGDLPPN